MKYSTHVIFSPFALAMCVSSSFVGRDLFLSGPNNLSHNALIKLAIDFSFQFTSLLLRFLLFVCFVCLLASLF